MNEATRAAFTALRLDGLVTVGSLPQTQDLAAALYAAIVILFLRVAAERALRPLIASLLRSLFGAQAANNASDVLDDGWITIFSGMLEALAIYNTWSAQGQ